ncbi:MAG: hypothetical protein ILA25_05055 [Prevotella sp.]|nr:hypothetical protein [Prevotella sp.]
MTRIGITIMLLWLALTTAHPQSDPRSLRLMGISLEGPVDSVRQRLQDAKFTPWGQSDDGEDYYYRGLFYGIRAKLLLTMSPKTGMVASAYVTIGPYTTDKMLSQNRQYFLYKLQKELGTFAQRDNAWIYMDDYGSVKLSTVDNGNGSRDIRILYMPEGTFYKDAISIGLHGPVQEIITENAVAEEQFMHFTQQGQLDRPELANRQYDAYGYLRHATMTEQQGISNVEYTYDKEFRLVRRTVNNATAGIRLVQEYIYNEQGDIATVNQKVYQGDEECVMSINLHNKYLTRDNYGNWTSNSATLNYWEKGGQSQQATVLQKRTIAYWE